MCQDCLHARQTYPGLKCQTEIINAGFPARRLPLVYYLLISIKSYTTLMDVPDPAKRKLYFYVQFLFLIVRFCSLMIKYLQSWGMTFLHYPVASEPPTFEP